MKLLFSDILFEQGLVTAADQAHKLGLKYAGWEKWKDKSGNTVAKTVNNKLVKLSPQEKQQTQKKKVANKQPIQNKEKQISEPGNHEKKEVQEYKEYHDMVWQEMGLKSSDKVKFESSNSKLDRESYKMSSKDIDGLDKSTVIESVDTWQRGTTAYEIMQELKTIKKFINRFKNDPKKSEDITKYKQDFKDKIEEIRKIWKPIVKLSEINHTKTEKPAFRGIGLESNDYNSFIKEFNGGEEIAIPPSGFTFSPKLALDFTDFQHNSLTEDDNIEHIILFKVLPKNGMQKGAFLPKLTTTAMYKHQNELVKSNKTPMKVISKKEYILNNKKYGQPRKTTIITLQDI